LKEIVSVATDWRWKYLQLFGPGGYPGFLVSDWLRLLRDNNFAVSPRYFVRASAATASIFASSTLAMFERWRYGADVEKTTVKAPLFILGHWRSGTTFLHKLLSLDERFAFPNLYQVSLPHIFLSTEAAATRLTRFQLPRTRPFDNVRQTWEMAYEDEIATAMLTLRSPYLCGLFPQRTEFYDRYLSFDGVPPQEIDEWRNGLLLFLKKLTLKYERPLILKSPPHTCRIRLLLEMFPDAKFVHIHRNPYTVFQSTMHLIDRGIPLLRFQRSDQVDWESRTLRVYREMYERFFEERSLIPKGNFHKICFEDVEKDALGQVRNVYETLDLPAFTQVESRLQGYLSSTVNYKKNEFPELTASLRDRIASEWQRSFDEWHYPKSGNGDG